MSKYCTVCIELRKKDVWPPDFPHSHDGEAWSKGLAEAIEKAAQSDPKRKANT